MPMDPIVIGIIAAIALLVLGPSIVVGIIAMRKQKAQTYTTVLFWDCSTKNALLWKGRPTGGRVTLDLKGRQPGDHILDSKFAANLYNLQQTTNGVVELPATASGFLPSGPVYVVDIMQGTPFEFQSAPDNYTRMPPERQYAVRKDTRRRQMGAVFESPWDKAIKYGAIVAVVLIVMMGIVIGIVTAG